MSSPWACLRIVSIFKLMLNAPFSMVCSSIDMTSHGITSDNEFASFTTGNFQILWTLIIGDRLTSLGLCSEVLAHVSNIGSLTGENFYFGEELRRDLKCIALYLNLAIGIRINRLVLELMSQVSQMLNPLSIVKWFAPVSSHWRLICRVVYRGNGLECKLD